MKLLFVYFRKLTGLSGSYQEKMTVFVHFFKTDNQKTLQPLAIQYI